MFFFCPGMSSRLTYSFYILQIKAGKATIRSLGHFKGNYKNGEIKIQLQKEFEPILSYFNKNKVFLPRMSQQLILIREANKVLDKQITLLPQQYTMRSNIS